MTDSNPDQKPKKPHKIIKANYILQARIGVGTIDDKLLQKCQDIIDNNKIDFQPLAADFLNQFQTALNGAKQGTLPEQEAIKTMAAAVMQIKANAATFHYTLVSVMANSTLNFIEALNSLNDDALQVIEAHYKTLNAVIAKKILGDGGATGKQMEQELEALCQRYVNKHGV